MDLVKRRYWFFFLSLLVILPGLISLMIPPSLKLGIDFTSGSTLNVVLTGPADVSDIQSQLNNLGHFDVVIQRVNERSFFIRTGTLKDAVLDGEGQEIEPSERARIRSAIEANVAPIESIESASVSPLVAQDTVRNAIIAVVVAAIFILMYITWAFRNVPKPFRYGTAAIIALVHDVLIVLGIFSILGKVINMEVNSMFIIGILTVIGFSVHDTIVVFDRIRENVALATERTLEATINTSLVESLGRSINTGLTLLFTVIALLLIGGPTIQGLLLVFLVGVTVGTYSSICIAAQLLIVWENRDVGRLFRFLLARRSPPVKK
jgi:preprotein translocase subunit SecF